MPSRKHFHVPNNFLTYKLPFHHLSRKMQQTADGNLVTVQRAMVITGQTNCEAQLFVLITIVTSQHCD